MAANKRPSFLKRQKEQARLARANEKREAKHARKQAKLDGKLKGESDTDLMEPLDGPVSFDDELEAEASDTPEDDA